MEMTGEDVGEDHSKTDVRNGSESREDSKEAEEEDTEKLRVLFVDKVTVEKIVLESSNGSREVLLTKNESSRKLSVNSEPGRRILRRTKDERKESTINRKFRVSLPEDAFASRLSGEFKGNNVNGTQSKLPLSRIRRDGVAQTADKRIKPLKLTKSPSIGSVALTGLRPITPSEAKTKVPPKVPKKPAARKPTAPSSTCTDNPTLLPENSCTNNSVGDSSTEDQNENVKEEVPQESLDDPGKTVETDVEKNDEERIEEKEDPSRNEDKSDASKKPESAIVSVEDTKVDKEAQDRLEKSQGNIEVLQRNLTTKINASTAQQYKEKLLGLRPKYILPPPPTVDTNVSDKPVAFEVAFDQDFLERHNLDKRLKIEEKRLLETDLDYVSDGERVDERLSDQIASARSARPNYSKKVSEIEKRWSGEFLESQLERNSSGSSKSSYVEEFGSVSSRESVVEDRRSSLFFERKHPVELNERQDSIDGAGRRASREILEDSTVSTVDSDSCLEDRIKAADADIDEVTNELEELGNANTDDDESDYKDAEYGDCETWKEETSEESTLTSGKEQPEEANQSKVRDESGKIFGINNNIVAEEVKAFPTLIGEKFSDEPEDNVARNSFTGTRKSLIDRSPALRSHSRRDGYANLIKEFTMEAGTSRVKKEEKPKKKLGLRRLLPGFFSPKDSRKDYKKKEQKERKRHDERHFARYQQNGNYTRSPDTMNLNEDIKRNVKLDNSLNGSIIEERLDEIKRELFPDQGPITSTPDHFAQSDDQRNIRAQRAQRSYTTDSSLSSIAPDDKWNDRIVQLGISPDIRKYEQRQKREELDDRRYGQLERKHSLQEPNNAGRPCFFQRNHGPSGRISAPPSERYLVRPRAIHPIDRPLPAIPHSRVELSNYENYDHEQRCDEMDSYDKRIFVPEKSDYLNQPELYENNHRAGRNADTPSLVLKSVSAQVKITRQPIVNQNQRAPLVGRTTKYPSPGSSQKSGDYADSSCTPNSSQKSEFSPSSSKSGEYYLHSPRSSGSPNDRAFDELSREGIYENENQRSPSSSSGRRTDERVYNETPTSPSREKCSPASKASDRSSGESPIKKEDFSPSRNSSSSRSLASKSSFQRSCDEHREMQGQRVSVDQTHRNADQNVSSCSGQNKMTPVSSPTRGTMTSRKAQPNDQILIASPKRELAYETRAPRPSNDSRNCALESPIPMTNVPHRVPGVPPHDLQCQELPNSRPTGKSAEQMSVSGPSKDLPRPEPIYGYRKQQVACRRLQSAPPQSVENKSERQEGNPLTTMSTGYETTKRDSDRTQPEKIAWVQGQASSPSRTSAEQRSAPIVTSTPCELPNVQAQESRIPRQELIAPRRSTAAQLSETQRSPLVIGQEKTYAGAAIYEQRVRQQQRRPVEDPIYVQRVPESIYGQQCLAPGGPLSPSKRETRQHLEAFYWQQKALEAHRKSLSPQTAAPAKPTTGKIDLPEVREAVYWQQLKKLDEEQQRRIYEQDLLEESQSKDGVKYPTRMPPVLHNPARQGPIRNSITTDLSISPITTDRSTWDNKLQRAKTNPPGKPPLMQNQKVQNQPVLIVRPQQAIRERREIPAVKTLDARDPSRNEAQRSKSASPHFHRGDVVRASFASSTKSNVESSLPTPLRKTETPTIYGEEGSELDGKPAPPPIFKRGSLVGGESVEYGSTGPKRVSFSNQSNAGTDLPMGSWPTKHGTAPEPPTRRHRSEDSTSDTDSVFSHQERREANQECLYGNPVPGPRTGETVSRARRTEASCPETEYDANRPLPPPPKEPVVYTRPGSAAIRSNVYSDHRRAISPTSSKKWSFAGSETEAGVAETEGQRLPRQRHEEEWNPDGKGRQSNDTGGSGRGEGDSGSNELTGGRRGVGGGGGLGGGGVGLVGDGGGGGSVLGVGSGGGVVGGGSGGRSTSGAGGGGRSRDEPRRHTLGGDHQPSLHHQQFNAAQQLHPLHPHHLPPPHGQYGTPPTRHTTMDLEMGTKSRQRKSPLPRGYPPPSSTMLFDDDPGIMSEVETSSTGFRRGGKQRSSLPVVRTPSKTLERPLGLVFLQYRHQTKRALLPNEITSIDTVKALFVRSFPKQLTMEYLDSPHVKIYIHDSNKDMFYELEDLRSHLRDIRDRSVLRLFESTDEMTGMPGPLRLPGGGVGLPPHWEDQSYFSEPEFDSEYQHQHIHKSKTAKNSTSGSSGYYVGGSSTLPRGGPLLRAYSPATSSVVGGPNATPTQPKALTTPGGGGVPPAKPLRSYQCGKSPLGSLGGSARFSRDSSVSLYSIPDRLHGESGYMSSPERGGGVGSGTGRYPAGPYSAGSSYEDPYYSQYSGTVTPVIDEEASDTELLEESYSLYGVKPPGRPPSGPSRSPFPPGAPPPLPPSGQSYDATRIRVEHMERQLANLTGLVQKALTHTSPSARDFLQVPAGRDPYARTAGAGDEFDKHSSSSSASLPDDSYLRTDVKPPKLGKDKSVSFEKSVSFSDEPPDMNSPKQHSPQHAADTKPTKPAIKSSTLPRMSSQERDRDRHKPTPPPKPAALVAGQYVYRDLALTPEMYNQLRGLQKKAKDLRQEVRNLRRMSQAQAHTVRETIWDTFMTIRAMLLSGGDAAWTAGDAEKIRLSREEDLYKQEMIRLEKDLSELESTVEALRGNVINRKTRVNMSDVENMALILSKSSKTVADLKVRFPSLQEGMKGLLSSEMEKVVHEEKFLKEEPERLESALKRCKKLAGTLVTLKRLASVQEQRLPNATSVDVEETPPITPTSAQHSKATAPVPAERTVVGSSTGVLGGGAQPHESSTTHQQRPENALDALLDELQTFSRPSSQLGQVTGVGGSVVHPVGGSSTILSDIGRSASREPAGATTSAGSRAPCISDIGRKGSVDSSSGGLSVGSTATVVGMPGAPATGGTLRRLHSYPSSSDTDTSPPIARLQVSLQEQPSLPVLPQGFIPGQKPPVPERNAELLQLASARRVPPPPPPRTSSRSPLASPTSPQLPPRNHSCNLQTGIVATLRRPATRGSLAAKEGKPPMALPPDATTIVPSSPSDVMTPGGQPTHNSSSSQSSAVLSTSNSSSCESVNSQEGMQSKRGRQEQLEQRHQELLRKQKALQEQYARLQQLQRNAAGLTTVPPAPPDLLKKTGSESNLLAKMGLGLSAASSGSLTSLTIKPPTSAQDTSNDGQPISSKQEDLDGQNVTANSMTNANLTTSTTTTMTALTTDTMTNTVTSLGSATSTGNIGTTIGTITTTNNANATTTTTSKIYETDIL